MSESSEMRSAGRKQIARGKEFEETVYLALRNLFKTVDRHRRVQGASGVGWKVDFVVDSSLIVEASVQRRLETKINSTFVRFVDITRTHPEFKAALVVEKVHVLFHHSQGKKYFPTSEYRAFLESGFPLLVVDDVGKLVPFKEGKVTAFAISSRPLGFNTKSILSSRTELRTKVFELLGNGPLCRREIARLLECSPGRVSDAIAGDSRIKKVSTYFGLDEDSIYRRLLTKSGNRSEKQQVLVRTWLGRLLVEKLHRYGSYSTTRFASDLHVSPSSLTHLIHLLHENGTIRKISKGKWTLENTDAQRLLT